MQDSARLKTIVQQQQARIHSLEDELRRTHAEYAQRLQEMTRKNKELHTCLCNEVCSAEKLRVYLSHLEEFKHKPLEELQSHLAYLETANQRLLSERSNLCITIDEVADTLEVAETRILKLTDENTQLASQLHSRPEGATDLFKRFAQCYAGLQAANRSHEEALQAYNFKSKDAETKLRIGQLESQIFALEQEKSKLEKLICEAAVESSLVK